MPSDEYLLDSEHYELFGKIVHLYAEVENGLKLLIAGMTGMSLDAALTMTATYSAQTLREVTATLLGQTMPKEPRLKPLTEILRHYAAVGVLRNHIAHDRWVEGEAKGSIKPIRLGITKSVLIVREKAEEFSKMRLHGAAMLLHTSAASTIAVFKACGYDKQLGLQ